VRIVCSYCRRDLGVKPPIEDCSLTHGMCPECADYFGRQWAGLTHSEYLERFDYPVVLLEAEGRVVAANRAAAAVLGREPSEAVGLLGGEAMECAHARLPEGCGKTVHCATCAIRNAVTRTHGTGVPLLRVPARLARGDRGLDLLLSTSLEGEVVRLVVEPVS
jgi:PAS domain-containing protein